MWNTVWNTKCNFEIFLLLILGNIRNTQKVYYKDRHNFILKIIAQDCGGKPSKAVFVNILVKEKCRPQWTSKGKKPDRWYSCLGSSFYRLKTFTLLSLYLDQIRIRPIAVLYVMIIQARLLKIKLISMTCGITLEDQD